MPAENPGIESPLYMVTGAGSGIGASLARRLAAHGARVLLVGRREAPLREVCDALPGQGHAIHLADTTQAGEVAALFAELKKSKAEVSGIAHCAGIHWLRPIQLTSPEHLREMLESHLQSALLLLRESVSSRVLAKEGASIVLISSAAAIQGGAGTMAYASAKAGLIAATRVAANEFASRRIRVNAVLPGVVDTPQSRAFLDRMTPEQRESLVRSHPLGIGAPEDVAAAAGFLLSKDARWITGTTLVVDGGLTAR